MKKRIPLEPSNTIYYIVDADFFANKYLRPFKLLNNDEQDRIRNSHKWWEVIDWQVEKQYAIVYVNELCIAESFKVIAKKYYREQVFNNNIYQTLKKKITQDIQVNIRKLVSKNRYIKYHNLTVDRDIIVGTSRYLEIAHKHKLYLSIIDLTVLSSAKYLMDFFRIGKEQIALPPL